ncbi:MAG: glycoside hydrolase family 30 protein [Sedimentisphaerales bacterium]|nr:glycoside hydrolase family 30 protein [Sedimentisphaerales bacterium]
MLQKTVVIGMISMLSILTGSKPETGPVSQTAEPEPKSVQVVITAKDTADRLTVKESIALSSSALPEAFTSITIDESITYQRITGFGGAFTEAAAYTLSKMSPEKRTEVLTAYFDPKKGIGYTLCRTHINSADFSLGNYAYTEVDGDFELKHFTIDRDRKWLIPMIKDALAVEGANFKIFSSPWSPPAWMKTNGQMNYGGQLKDECRDVWARYYARYIKEYAKEGITIWGLTVQNEPAATQTWDSCIYSAKEEGAFVRDFLGPTLEREGLGDVKIIVWDHNKDIIYERAEPILSDPETAKYVWGVGFHWYSGDEFENLAKVHDAFPSTNLLFTEGCQEGGVRLGAWDLGERYAHDIIGDLNNWTVGWVDWNMVLDERGGPNHVDNLCDAPVIADTTRNDLYYQSSFYYMGHFSKYIRPGAVRIAGSTTNKALETTAFKNPDNSIAIVVMNRTDKEIKFNLKIDQKAAACSSPAHSIITMVY